jgi:hypothetical protein
MTIGRVAVAALILTAVSGRGMAEAAENTPRPAAAAIEAPADAANGKNGFVQPSAPGTDSETLRSAPAIPSRFGTKAPDEAFGAFQRGLYITAYNLALPRAQEGDGAAQTLVAEILSRGLGVVRKPAEAAEWYRKAAEAGIPEAKFQYALLMIDGKYATRDEERAFALMKEAADSGNRLAAFNLAQMLVDREPGPRGMNKAVPYYEKAARAGLADAQYAMAQIHATGVLGPPDDVKARNFLALAAMQNFDSAQLDLATWLVEGRGGKIDYEAGFGWMRRAALAGNVAAQNRLAKLYVYALGTEPDPILAAAWYIKARRAGLRDLEMEDFLQGLTPEEQKMAIERANRLG